MHIPVVAGEQRIPEARVLLSQPSRAMRVWSAQVDLSGVLVDDIFLHAAEQRIQISVASALGRGVRWLIDPQGVVKREPIRSTTVISGMP